MKDDVDKEKRWDMSAGENYSLAQRVSGCLSPESAQLKAHNKNGHGGLRSRSEEHAVFVCLIFKTGREKRRSREMDPEGSTRVSVK